MMQTMLAAMMARDLRACRRELEAYPDEAAIWATPPGVSNSAGTLALHLAGNLRAFIGAQLGGDGYVRDRDAEFASRGVPRADLLGRLDEARAAVERTLPTLSDADLAKPFPMAIGGATITTADFLLHLSAHLAYHLGQCDYHRRIVTGTAGTVGAVSPLELSSARKNA